MKVSARLRWQPQVFEDLEQVQTLAVGSLRRAVAESFKTVHDLKTYVIMGPEGSGKSTVARILAQELGLNPHWYQLEWLIGSGQTLPVPDTSQDAYLFEDIDGFGRLNLAKVARNIVATKENGVRGALIMTACLPDSIPLYMALPNCLAKLFDVRIELPILTDQKIRAALQAHLRRMGETSKPHVVSYLAKHAYGNLNAAVDFLYAVMKQHQQSGRPLTKPLVRRVFAEEALNCHGLADLGCKLMSVVNRHDGCMRRLDLVQAMDWPSELCDAVIESLVASDDLVREGKAIRRVTPLDGPPRMRIESTEE